MNGCEKFTGKAELYSKYRPSYPMDIISYLSRFIKASDTVADIGAGTGKFTKMLCHLGCNIIAVEPNSDMLMQASEYLQNYENLTLIKSPAEDTMLADDSVKLVTVAQAFHWFDVKAFKSECHRILKLGGKVMLIWNTADYSKDIIKERNSIADTYCKEFSQKNKSTTPLKGNSEDIKLFFSEGEYETFLLRNDLTYDMDEFLGYELSRSYAPKEEDRSYQPYLRALKEFFTAHQQEGKILIPNVTECYVGTV